MNKNKTNHAAKADKPLTHTPGDWHIEHAGRRCTRIAAPDSLGYIIAELNPDAPKQEGNAALIVTATRLLAECERFLGLFDRARIPGEITQAPEGIEQLRRTILAAKGGAL